MAAYHALFEPAAEGGYVVTFPDFGDGGTQGDTIEEAHEMAEDLLKSLLSRTMKERRPIPPPGKTRGRNLRAVRLSALVAAKIELYNAMRKQGVRKSGLARRMRQPKQQVERLLDLRHACRLDQLEAPFGALNEQLSIEVRNAA